MHWLDDGCVIKVVAVPKDPVAFLRGRGAGEGLVEALLTARRRDRDAETPHSANAEGTGN